MFDVTVTFDNGPEPSITPGVLDVLRRGVRTTFFVIGSKLQNRGARARAERAHAEGHWIGNHTWTHSRPLGEDPGAAVAELEIARTQAEIGALSHSDRLFRPTGGGGHLDRRLLSAEAAALLEAGGYTLRAVERGAARLGGPGRLGRDRARAARATALDIDGAARRPERRAAPPRPLPGRGGGAAAACGRTSRRRAFPSPAGGSPGRSRISSAQLRSRRRVENRGQPRLNCDRCGLVSPSATTATSATAGSTRTIR